MTETLRRPRVVSWLALCALLLCPPSTSHASSSESAPVLDASRRAALMRSAADPGLASWQREFATRVAQESSNPSPVAPDSPDGDWSVIPPPSGRYGHTAVYDAAHRRMIVFGGYDNFRLNDVWILSLDDHPTWTWLVPDGAQPTPRYRHSAIVDPLRDRMLVFGGDDGHNLNDVWALSLSEPMVWSPVTTSGSAPPGRREHTAIYDPVRQRMVVYGGYRGAAALADAWALSLASGAWSKLNPSGVAPARYRHSAIYDPPRDRMVVFGGSDSTLSGDCWALTLSGSGSWSPLTAGGAAPTPRCEHTAIYDVARDRMIVYGGHDGAPLALVFALSLGGTPAWSPLTLGGTALAAHHRHTAVYDPRNHTMVVFGGMSPYKDSETWSLDLTTATWNPYAVMGTPPTPRVGYSSVYDPLRDRMILFGGHKAASYLAETWVLWLAGAPRWTKLSVSGVPPAPRAWHSAVYDPIGDRMIVFGGDNATACFDDAWSLTLSGTPRWAPLAPTGTAPSPRSRHAALYDSPRRRMVLWGGRASDGADLGDGFALTLGATPAWSPLSAEGAPPARAGHAAAFDVLRNRMLVYSGFHDVAGDSVPLKDLWALDLAGTAGWTRLVDGRSPRGCLWMIYDPVRDRLSAGVMAGETSNLSVETWTLALGGPIFGGTMVWKKIEPLGVAPPTLGSNAIYDARRDRLVFFGGLAPEGFSGDTWALSWRLPLKPVIDCATDVVRQVTPAMTERYLLINPMDVPRLVDWRLVSGSLPGFPVRGSLTIAGHATETLSVALPPLPSSTDTTVVALWAAFAGADGNYEICDRKFVDVTTAVLASLVRAEAEPGRARLAWRVAARARITIERRTERTPWMAVGVVDADDGMVAFEDETVVSGSRYGYRLSWTDGGAHVVAGDLWLDVPAGFSLALRGARPNPSAGALAIAFSLPARGTATLEIYDVAGRRAAERRLDLPAGFHVVGVDEARGWPPGVYAVRLRYAGRTLETRAVVSR